MAGKRILWLCSWYPDRLEPFNGDFVQRHARAAALFNEIYVIHLAGDRHARAKTHRQFTEMDGVKEDIIYYKKTWLPGRLFNYRRWLNAYKHAIKNYIDQHGIPDLVHVHVPFRDGMLAIWTKKQHQVPYIVTEHWTIYQPGNQVKFERRKKWLKTIINWVIRNSSLLLPVSQDLGRLMNKLVTPKEFLVVENVADTALFSYKENMEPDRFFRFIHVSTMGFQKNPEGLIRAFTAFRKNYPNTELVMVGPVPVELKQYLEQPELKKHGIIFKGEVSYERVALEMQQSDALVLFSRYENSPCSIIEALCCGLPVIATRVGGIPELVNTFNGILVEPGNEGALTAAFNQLVNNYTQYDRKKISLGARSRFSYQVIGERLDAVYSGVIQKK